MRSVLMALIGLAIVLRVAAQPVDPVVVKAKSMMNSNQEEEAVELLQKAVAEKPNDAVRHFWLANAYGSLAEKASMFKILSLAGKAGEEFEKAVRLDPNYIDARFGLMEFYLLVPGFMGGSVEKAHQQAVEIRKRDVLAGHRAFADVAAARKDMKTALAEHEAALRIDPKHMPSHYQIGRLAAISGTNLARGEETLQKYLAHKPDDDDPPLSRAHYWLGVIYERQGKKAAARSQFQASLRLRPGDKEVKAALKRVS